VAPTEAGAETLLHWAAESFPGRGFLSVSFGGGGLVLAHMISRLGLDIPVVFLDTGLHFAETYVFRNQFTTRYRLRRLDLEPVRDVGPLFRTDPESCCRTRKVEPMARLLDRFDLWITAIRRDQGAEREQVAVIDEVELGGGRRTVKLNPLAEWTRDQIESYLDRHEVPRHPLASRGYASIGCWPCTRPIAIGAPERSGRWVGREKTECGLHNRTLAGVGTELAAVEAAG
jgi:phosphoadenosine phosphosulfate reductase